MSVMDLSNSY